MKGEHVGEFEELVLLTVYGLGSEAYGVTIQEALERAAERLVSMGAVYAALDRLERKSYVKSRTGGRTKERGGRRKRFFSVSPPGVDGQDALRGFGLWLLEQSRIDQSEDRRVRPDAEREGHDADRGEASILDERSKTVANVLEKCGHGTISSA